MPARKAPILGGGNVSLEPGAFEAPFNMALVHETVRAELNARRRGTASTLTRGKVRGGGAKPWRQKGTGRARAGSNRSPLWAGGGRVFGPTPRSYVVKVNRKARQRAFRSALSQHASRESLAVFDASAFEEPSTSQAAQLLEEWGADSPTLVILSDEEPAAGKSFRNLARVEAMPVTEAGVADLIGAASLLVSQAAMPDVVARAVDRARAGAADAATTATPAPDASTTATSGPDAVTTATAAPDAATTTAGPDAPDSGASNGDDGEAA
jgi:large subunit ribosomal protein L4